MRKKRSRFYLLLTLLIMATAFMAVAMPSITKTQVVAQAAEKQGWHGSGKTCYYVNSKGKRATKGWLKLNGKTYFINKSGYRVLGLNKIGTKYYYFNKYNGTRMTGWKKIGGAYYYFKSKNGYRMTGWLTVGGQKYYLSPSKSGQRVTGIQKIGKYRYYFDKNGRMKKGWIQTGGKKYYALSNGRLVTGWKLIGSKKYYFDSTGALKQTTSNMNAGLKKSTLLTFLKTAMKPAGRCMYVWGGGWNKADTGAGIEAVTLGVSPTWKTFFNAQTSSYNYNTTRYQISKGLDCSGFVGWAVYNTFQTKNNQEGFVMLADRMAKNFANRGWGTYKAAGTYSDFRAGDIMSSSGHVYIVIGQCADGSVVLLHSSPPGVQLSGTCTRSGNYNSQAIKLATKYMKKYRTSWYNKYPKNSRGTSYLTSFARMRWALGSSKMMTDPEGLAYMNAEEVLKSIFGEK